MKSFIVTVVIALLFFLALLLGSQNEQTVTVSYFIASGEYRLPVLLAGVFLSGFMISWLFALYHIAKLKMQFRAMKKKLQQEHEQTVKEQDA